MFQINENYLKLQGSYLFSTIAGKIRAYSELHPDKEIIRLGIGDVTLPLAPAVISALFNSRLAKANRVMVTVQYFVPCADQDAFGPEKGRYETASGMVLNVDEFHETLTLQEENSKAVIDFADLLSIEPENPRLFEDCPDWE